MPHSNSSKSFPLFLSLFSIFLLLASCQKGLPPFQNVLSTAAIFTKKDYPKRTLDQQFKDYWYDGKAEITSYQLKQSRYGELRMGSAVRIFVTEDFLPDEEVKANQAGEHTISVLKQNTTKNFVTGIYPYSIMSSTFFPLNRESHAIKVVNSSQEWCGQRYTQLNNRDGFQITEHSYIEGEADRAFRLSENILEDELWTRLRIAPDQLPTGSQDVIPSLEYLRLNHKKIKAYPAQITKTDSTYTIRYPNLARTLIIEYQPVFPYTVDGWQETIPLGPDQKPQTSTAVRLKTLKTPYWKRNSAKFTFLRDSLGL